MVKSVDDLNRSLPEFHPIIREATPNSEFVEGAIKILESPHTYPAIASSIIQEARIEGASFLSLVFDEKCSTASPGDYLQIFEDASCLKPIGDRCFVDRWPRYLTIPGEVVYFKFNSEAPRSVSQDIASRWGYRCKVTGYIPASLMQRRSLPWSIHLEKTLCCLAGQLSGSLITGDPVSEYEQIHFASNPLFDATDATTSRVFEEFSTNLIKNVGNGETFSNWANNTIDANRPLPLLRIPIKNAERAVLAALLHHLNLTAEAIQQSVIFDVNIPNTSESTLENLFTQQHTPRPGLTNACKSVRQVSEYMVKQHQITELDYDILASTIIKRAYFLLHFPPQQTTSPDVEIIKDVLRFILQEDAELDEVVNLRRQRWIYRKLGFDSMKNIILCASFPSMKYEALYFVGPAIKSAGNHYMDNLSTGTGEELQVQRSYYELLKELGYILKDTNGDPMVQLLCLDAWTIQFKQTDEAFIIDSKILNTLHRLITTHPSSSQSISQASGRRTSFAIDEAKAAKRKLAYASINVFSLIAIQCLGSVSAIFTTHLNSSIRTKVPMTKCWEWCFPSSPLN